MDGRKFEVPHNPNIVHGWLGMLHLVIPLSKRPKKGYVTKLHIGAFDSQFAFFLKVMHTKYMKSTYFFIEAIK
jgi:hypothetical protein